MPERLSQDDRNTLLRLARQTLSLVANRQAIPALDPNDFSPELAEDGASFVTLTLGGSLRGCIGTLEAYQPLVVDVQTRAMQAASQDPRFPPVAPDEVRRIKIEISRLSKPIALPYDAPADLPKLLKPGIDGVVISDGPHRATFLPQVWDDLPDPEQFLAQLCRKMGCSSSHWKYNLMQVQTYRVEEFSE